jgi:hypothetical protein
MFDEVMMVQSTNKLIKLMMEDINIIMVRRTINPFDHTDSTLMTFKCINEVIE